MRRLESKDVKEIGLLKHYRIIRRWACRNNGLNDADLELLIFFDCMDLFTKQDYIIGTYAYSWDNKRWNNLLKEGWIVVWRKRNHTTQKYNIYKATPGAVAPISAIPPPVAPVAPVASQVPSTFSPRAQATAANIYGTPIDGSFGRQMNQPV